MADRDRPRACCMLRGSHLQLLLSSRDRYLRLDSLLTKAYRRPLWIPDWKTCLMYLLDAKEKKWRLFTFLIRFRAEIRLPSPIRLS